MRADDPNLPLLDLVARALEPLDEKFVFIGGCAAGLLVTDTAASPVRATQDVDVIIEVISLAGYRAVERKLEKIGMKHDRRPDAPICRWIFENCMLDVMPTDEKILGFSNQWYKTAARTAKPIQLPSGRSISLIAADAFLGTKLEAFHGRGNNDFFASHDLEDIIVLVDGRAELIQETRASSTELRNYLADEIGKLLRIPQFLEALPAHLPGDDASQARIPLVRDRLVAISRCNH